MGVDPGFFHQSAALLTLLERLPGQVAQQGGSAGSASSGAKAGAGGGTGGGVLGSVLCAGLSCVDMQLLRAADPDSREAIARFSGCEVAAGGSASNSASALRAMGVDAAVLTCRGDDVHGAEL